MPMIASPSSLQELCELVRQSSQLIPYGANSKSALSVCNDPSITRIDMKSFASIVSYEPTEFLITARSGTPVKEIEQALGAKGQYLPFDPIWKERGSTIGGAVASGLSGPSRILYGSLRDFMLEIEMVDGLGRLVRGGAKVVKNAAGFDFPKLMVGSYGRLGILTEVTLKVFPKPAANLTLSWKLADLPTSVRAMLALLGQSLQIAAIDIDPPNLLLVRLAGPIEALAAMADRADASVGSVALRLQEPEAEHRFWHDRAEMSWLEQGSCLVRVAITAHQIDALASALKGIEIVRETRFSCAGAVAWLAVDLSQSIVPLNDALEKLGLSAIVVSGDVAELTSLGNRQWHTFASRIQHAIDPNGKFVGFTRKLTQAMET